MRRLLFASLLLVLVLPASAPAGTQRQVRTAARQFQQAWYSGDPDAVCALMPASLQGAVTQTWAQIMGQPAQGCSATVAQQRQTVPDYRPESDPALRKRLQQLRLRGIRTGRVTVRGSKAVLRVRYRAPGCRSHASWELERIDGRWAVTDLPSGERDCFARAASPAQRDSLRQLVAQQIAFSYAGDADSYCRLTEPWSWRMFASLLGVLGLELQGQCLSDLRAVWQRGGLPPAADQPAHQAAVASSRWRVRGDHAWSAPVQRTASGCRVREHYEAWRVGEQWLVAAPSDIDTRC